MYMNHFRPDRSVLELFLSDDSNGYDSKSDDNELSKLFIDEM